ncbi:MBL fold metallo-hydrolase [Nocardia thailandica]|uniref:MBL fold metallo-hydrolase n=1 Tax=Nocardia thailandica TaxID=257275 RepID=UPI0002DFFD14|nr:MBL fold metallo-hydrolase [Nocardia thailandica]
MRYEQVAPEVFRVEGTHVNMVLVREGRELTLIDAGWLRDAAVIERTIAALGHRPEDLRGVLLTHAHLDHVGALNHLHRRYGIPVYASAVEVAHAHGDVHESATPLDVVKRLTDRRTLGWAVGIACAGGLLPNTVPHARAFPAEGPLDLPGRPVPVSCPGHTSGHSGFHLPDVGVLATGDALVTAHPTSRIAGPQPLPDFFNHDTAATLDSYAALAAVPADTLVPGHGPVWSGGAAEAVAVALENAPRQRK